MLVACRQWSRWHTVITIRGKFEIFIFCRQSPADLTFQLFSWDCLVPNRYSSCPAEVQPACVESFFHSPTVFLLTAVRRSPTVRFHMCQKALCFFFFFFAFICQKIACNQIPFFSLYETCAFVCDRYGSRLDGAE